MWRETEPARKFSPAAWLMIFFCPMITAAHAADQPNNTKIDPNHAAKMAKGRQLFTRHVRKLLVDHCLKCHGGAKTKGEFDLTTRAALLRGGAEGAAIDPGKASASYMVKLIKHLDDPKMPQKAEKLPNSAISLIEQWIDLGAPYDKPLAEKASRVGQKNVEITDKDRNFWSYQPLAKQQPPKVSDRALAQWIRTPVDRYIATTLKEKNLTPNTVADKRRLLRRAYFDLIGLPPTPQDLQRFVEDTAPGAFARQIDQLLQSPHFGERWGRHWLDVARFAESHGFEQDYNRPNAFHFRDFVIKALNMDMPFDQFVRWQIAGDEIEPDNPLAMMATGFLGAGVFPTQLTEKEFESARYDELDDMTNTLGTAMLGQTIGCARCHHHPYDPFSNIDYYRFISTFGLTIRSEIDLSIDSANIKQAQAGWQKNHDVLIKQLADFERTQLPARFDKWLTGLVVEKPKTSTWIILDLIETRSQGGAVFKKLDDGSLLATGKNPKFDTYTFTALTHLRGIRSIRLEALADKSMKRKGPGRAGNGNFALTDFSMTVQQAGKAAKTSKPNKVKLINPRVTFEQRGLPIKATIDNNKKSAWAVDPQFGKNHAAVFDLEKPIDVDGQVKLTFTLKFENNTAHTIGRPRLSISTSTGPLKATVATAEDSVRQNVIEVAALIARAGDPKTLTGKQRVDLLGWYKTTDTQWRALNKKVQDHLAKKPKPKTAKVMVSSEGLKPIKHHADGRGYPHFYKKTFMLKRGDPNQKGPEVQPGFLPVLMKNGKSQNHWQLKPPANARTSYRRRSLANWITDTHHGPGHLLARVIVNRLWQHHMGTGIVDTPNDFGFQGSRPTHPLLLDYLASQLIKNKWRLKPIHKLIMTSAVYMQSASFDQADSRIDPKNTYYWRFNRRRLDAEVIRDSMLSISGQLDKTMFGPGSLDEGMKRRSIYFMTKRSKLIPMMQLFDAPQSQVSIGARPTTTIAPQALMFMNSTHVREYARSLAAKLRTQADQSLNSAVDQIYLSVLSRLPTDAERADNLEFIKQQTDSYTQAKRGDANQLALTDLCQVLLSLNEFVYVD